MERLDYLRMVTEGKCSYDAALIYDRFAALEAQVDALSSHIVSVNERLFDICHYSGVLFDYMPTSTVMLSALKDIAIAASPITHDGAGKTAADAMRKAVRELQNFGYFEGHVASEEECSGCEGCECEGSCDDEEEVLSDEAYFQSLLDAYRAEKDEASRSEKCVKSKIKKK